MIKWHLIKTPSVSNALNCAKNNSFFDATDKLITGLNKQVNGTVLKETEEHLISLLRVTHLMSHCCAPVSRIKGIKHYHPHIMELFYRPEQHSNHLTLLCL